MLGRKILRRLSKRQTRIRTSTFIVPINLLKGILQLHTAYKSAVASPKNGNKQREMLDDVYFPKGALFLSPQTSSTKCKNTNNKVNNESDYKPIGGNKKSNKKSSKVQ